MLDGLGIEPGWIRERTFEVGRGPDSIRIAHFTDVHFKGDGRLLEAAVRRINASGSGFAVFTGDLIEEARHLSAALEILSGLRMPLLGIPGNHDHWSGADFGPAKELFERTGGRWLEDEDFDIGDRIQVVGLDHPRHTLPTRKGVFRLLLVHYPAWADQIQAETPTEPFDLVLAGHTHGGQVRIPGIGALVTPYDTGGYELGWYRTPSGPLYVNPGIGTFFADVRFLCRPEITYFDLRHGGNGSTAGR